MRMKIRWLGRVVARNASMTQSNDMLTEGRESNLLTLASRARNAEYLANADGTLSSHKSRALFKVTTSSNAEFNPGQDQGYD